MIQVLYDRTDYAEVMISIQELMEET